MLQRFRTNQIYQAIHRGASTTALDWTNFELKNEQEEIEDVLRPRGQITHHEAQTDRRSPQQTVNDVWEDVREMYRSVEGCLGRSLNKKSRSIVYLFLEAQIPAENVLDCLDRYPELLHLTRHDLEQRIKQFRDLGMKKTAVYEMLLAYPEIFGLDFEQEIQPIVTFLEKYLGRHTSIADLISKAPVLLTYSIEKEIRPKIDFFKEFGFGGVEIVRLIESYPSILALSLDRSIRPKIDYLQSRLPMMNIKKAIATFPGFLDMSLEEHLKEKLDFFLDTLDAQPRKLAQYLPHFPQIFSCEIDGNIKLKIEFICRKMHVVKGRKKRMRIVHPRSMGFIACPSLFGFSRSRLAERIKRLKHILFQNDQLLYHIFDVCPLVFGCTIRTEDIERIGVILMQNVDNDRSHFFKILSSNPEILTLDPTDLESLLESMFDHPVRNRVALLSKGSRVNKGLETIKRLELL